LKTDTNPYSWP